MRIFDSKPALRLIAPLAFVLVMAGTSLIAATASADNKLPARTPQELLVDLQQAKTDGLSGTIVETRRSRYSSHSGRERRKRPRTHIPGFGNPYAAGAVFGPGQSTTGGAWHL